MKIGDAIELLTTLYGSGHSAILLGGVGVGKTEGAEVVARRVAHKRGREFIVYDGTNGDLILSNPDKYSVFVAFAASHLEPTDLIGIPREKDGYLVFKPLEWAEVLRRAGGVLFIDEITNLSRLDQQTAMLRLFCEKTAGYIRLPDTVMIIGAGNEESQSSLATELSEPLRAGKALLLRIEEPTLDAWQDYMDAKYGDWDRRILLYLKKFPKSFNAPPEKGTENAPVKCPRVWSRLATMSHKLDGDMMAEFAAGYIGSEAATLGAFLSTKIPPIEEVNKKPDMWETLPSDAKYFLVLEMAQAKLEYKNLLRYIAKNDREALEMFIFLVPAKERQSLIKQMRDKMPDVLKELIEVSIRVSKLLAEVERQ
jgi:hypothetical protein